MAALVDVAAYRNAAVVAVLYNFCGFSFLDIQDSGLSNGSARSSAAAVLVPAALWYATAGGPNADVEPRVRTRPVIRADLFGRPPPHSPSRGRRARALAGGFPERG